MDFAEIAFNNEVKAKREQELITESKSLRYRFDLAEEAIASLKDERKTLLITMRAEGFTLNELSELSGLSVPTIHKLTSLPKYSD
jgi:DNA-directed RNA polymerase specialized sigma24 family protein